MIAAEIPPQESKPKKKSSAPELSSRAKNSEKDLPKNWSEERGTTAHLRKNLAARKKAEQERMAKEEDDKDVTAALRDLEKIEAKRAANDTQVDLPAIRRDAQGKPITDASEAFADLEKIEADRAAKEEHDSDVNTAFRDLAQIEAERVASASSSPTVKLPALEKKEKPSARSKAIDELVRIEEERVAQESFRDEAEQKSGFSKTSKEKIAREKELGKKNIESLELLLPKNDIVALLDVLQVQELDNIQMWKEAKSAIAKNITDLTEIRKKIKEAELLDDGALKQETLEKLEKARDLINTNYKKLSEKVSASDKQIADLRANFAEENIRHEVVAQNVALLEDDIPVLPTKEEALVYKIDAARALANRFAGNPAMVEIYTNIVTTLNNERKNLTTERLTPLHKTDSQIREYKPSKENVLTRQKEDMMAIELEINGLRTIGDARSREIIPILLKQHQAIKSELLKNSKDDFFARAESGEESFLDTLTANDIDTSEKLIRAALARNQDKPAIVAEANRRLAAIAKQREDISEVLSNRNVNINSGESSYPRTMGRAGRESSVSVSRGRPGEIIGMREQREDAQRRSLSPFVAMDQFISKARTEALFSDDEYVPGILRTQRRTLMEARAKRLEEKDEVSVKDIDVTIGKIDSALRQLDLDRVNEALGTIENRLAQAKEKYTENSGNPVVASSWRNRMNMYQEQAAEASRDARDLLVEDINNHLSTLGVSEKDFQTMVFGKVSPFSNAKLWWIKLRNGGEIAKIRTMIKRRNDLQGRMPE